MEELIEKLKENAVVLANEGTDDGKFMAMIIYTMLGLYYGDELHKLAKICLEISNNKRTTITAQLN